ncbi:NYN domain [Bordetella ansorpii]|uniref:NYN domain n=1 Tax=Bordetella ansorpii TaxID=288768 RepID=A0A157SHC8_9BORD|nr:NYN domain-containing protein [Bordetella ansorpii]SAI69827.1 NYN domain [Bordetella ansorpii]
MDRLAIFVDAGYLLSQAAKVLSAGGSQQRSEVDITDHSGLVQYLIGVASRSLQNSNLLRVYWYDGVRNGAMTTEHRKISEVDDVQFRAGTVNGTGQQKGVDSKIVTDLIELASNHAICDALLVTGDGDIAIGVELAQKKGVRVAILGIAAPNIVPSQNPELLLLADRHIVAGVSDVSPYLTYRRRSNRLGAQSSGAAVAGGMTATSQSPALGAIASPSSNPQQVSVNAASGAGATGSASVLPPAAISAPVPLDDQALLDRVVRPFFSRQQTPLVAQHVAPQIDAEVDRKLLRALSGYIGGRAAPSEVSTVRRLLRQLVLRQIT